MSKRVETRSRRRAEAFCERAALPPVYVIPAEIAYRRRPDITDDELRRLLRILEMKA